MDDLLGPDDDGPRNQMPGLVVSANRPVNSVEYDTVVAMQDELRLVITGQPNACQNPVPIMFEDEAGEVENAAAFPTENSVEFMHKLQLAVKEKWEMRRAIARSLGDKGTRDQYESECKLRGIKPW